MFVLIDYCINSSYLSFPHFCLFSRRTITPFYSWFLRTFVLILVLILQMASNLCVGKLYYANENSRHFFYFSL